MRKALGLGDIALTSFAFWLFALLAPGSSQEIVVDLEFGKPPHQIDRPFVLRLRNPTKHAIRIVDPNGPKGHQSIELKLFDESSKLVSTVSPMTNLSQNPERWYQRSGDLRDHTILQPGKSTTTLVWPGMWPWRMPNLDNATCQSLQVSIDIGNERIRSGTIEMEPEKPVTKSGLLHNVQLSQLRNSNKAVVELFAAAPELARKRRGGFNLLHLAAKVDDVEAMNFLLRSELFDVNATSTDGFTALQLAKSPNAIDVLLKHGAKSELDSAKGTAVEIAAKNAIEARRLGQLEREKVWLDVLEVYRDNFCQETSWRNAVALGSHELVGSLDLETVSDSDLQTLFESAVDLEDLELCKYFVRQASARLRRHPNARSVVFGAVDSPRVLRLLVESAFPYDGNDFVQGGRLGKMPILFHACGAGQSESVRILMSAVPQFQDEVVFSFPIGTQKFSLLDAAAGSGSIEVYNLVHETLLKSKLNEEFIDKLVETSLGYALEHPKTLRHILESLEDVPEELNRQLVQDAVYWLRSEDDQATAQKLRSSMSALISLGGVSDLLVYVAVGNIDQIERFLKGDEKLLSTTYENKSTIFHSRLLLEQPQLLDFLLLQSSEKLVLREDGSGRTCLHLACLIDILDASIRIMQYDSIINRTDSLGRTALHYACVNCNARMVEQLLECGAKADARDNNGHTPWDLAKATNSATKQRKTHLQLAFASRFAANESDPNERQKD